MKDNQKYIAGCPGIASLPHSSLADKEVTVVGSENRGVEVGPNRDASLAAPVHQLLIAWNGISTSTRISLRKSWRAIESTSSPTSSLR